MLFRPIFSSEPFWLNFTSRTVQRVYQWIEMLCALYPLAPCRVASVPRSPEHFCGRSPCVRAGAGDISPAPGRASHSSHNQSSVQPHPWPRSLAQNQPKKSIGLWLFRIILEFLKLFIPQPEPGFGDDRLASVSS